MEYNLCVKIDGKFKAFGKVATNKWGNLQASFKNSPELKALVNGDTQWLNFSMFEQKPKDEKPQEKPAQTLLDDTINF